jgi:Family of unknown function (DUF6152)
MSRTSLGILALLAALPALAHHSAAQFNFQAPASVEGVVKEFRMANPHMRLVLMVSNDKGPHEVEFEGHSLNNLYRRGWRQDSMKVGDKVTISIAPRKDGGEGGYVLSVKTPDGKEF